MKSESSSTSASGSSGSSSSSKPMGSGAFLFVVFLTAFVLGREGFAAFSWGLFFQNGSSPCLKISRGYSKIVQSKDIKCKAEEQYLHQAVCFACKRGLIRFGGRQLQIHSTFSWQTQWLLHLLAEYWYDVGSVVRHQYTHTLSRSGNLTAKCSRISSNGRSPCLLNRWPGRL